MHNATKRNIIARRRRLTWAGSLNPGNFKSPRNRPRFNGRNRISVVIRGIHIPATILCSVCMPGAAVRSARLTGSRHLARGRHRPTSIERHFLEQAAMFISSTVRFAAHSGLGQRAMSEKCQQATSSLQVTANKKPPKGRLLNSNRLKPDQVAINAGFDLRR